jgi:hypothetical protein
MVPADAFETLRLVIYDSEDMQGLMVSVVSKWQILVSV